MLCKKKKNTFKETKKKKEKKHFRQNKQYKFLDNEAENYLRFKLEEKKTDNKCSYMNKNLADM